MTSVDIEHLIDIIADGIYVLHTLEGVPLTKGQARERGRGIATQVICEHEMRRLPEPKVPNWDAPVPERIPTWDTPPKVAELRELYAQGKPEGHGRSCACRDCKVFNQSRRAQ